MAAAAADLTAGQSRGDVHIKRLVISFTFVEEEFAPGADGAASGYR